MKTLTLAITLFTCLSSAQMGMNENYNPHPPFTDKGDLFDQDESIPAEQRVIKLTGEIYDEIVTSRWGTQLNGDTPWVILFLTIDQIDCRRAMTHYKKTAV